MAIKIGSVVWHRWRWRVVRPERLDHRLDDTAPCMVAGRLGSWRGGGGLRGAFRDGRSIGWCWCSMSDNCVFAVCSFSFCGGWSLITFAFGKGCCSLDRAVCSCRRARARRWWLRLLFLPGRAGGWFRRQGRVPASLTGRSVSLANDLVQWMCVPM